MGLADLPLLHCAVLTPTREGVPTATRKCIDELRELGAERLDLAGCSDVTLARNILLSQALTRCPEKVTVFLLVDDDILFDRGQAQLLCEQALDEGRAVSAVYPTNELSIAAQRYRDGLWLVGLGFCAVPRVLLAEFARANPAVEGQNGLMVHPFCRSAPNPEGSQWWSEDYWFSHNMGGVRLARMAVRHHKRMPLFADEYTLALLCDPPKAEEKEENDVVSPGI